MDDLRISSTGLLSPSRLPSSPELSPIQARVDGLVSSFTDQATNPYSLTALVAGGMAYRLGRIGVLSVSANSASLLRGLAQPGLALSVGVQNFEPLQRIASIGIGLGMEVTAFEVTQRELRVGLEGESPSLLDWNGSNGLRNGLIHSALNFGVLRGTASLTQGQNLFLQNLLQDSAMVLSHNLSAAVGISPRPSGSLAEQFLEAQVLGLQMQAGVSLIHGVAPSLSSLERGLDLSVRLTPSPLSLTLEGEGGHFEPALSPGGRLPHRIRPHGPERSEPMLMAISDFLPWRTKGRSPSPSSQESIWAFQFFYDHNEIFPIGPISEGQEVTLGRESSDQPGIFPTSYRNISRRHFDLRIQEGRLEIRAHQGSRGLRINEFPLFRSQWYLLEHGDVVEFISEAKQESALTYLNDDVQDNDRPAVFRFIRMGELPFEMDVIPEPSPRMAPETIRSALEELRRLRESFDGVLNLYGGGLREVRGQLDQNPQLSPENFALPDSILNVGDIVNAHRHLCGEPERYREFILKKGTPEASRIRVPDFRGLLLEKFKFYWEAARQYEDRQGADALSQGAREDLATVRDSLDRMYQTLRILGRFFRTPQERAFMKAVEGAYEGLRLESAASAERVRSETLTLDLTLRQAERESWIRGFLQRTFDPQVVRLVNLLTGKVSIVQGRPLGGSFYEALGQGTIYEGFRTVRGLVDTQTGEFVAFRDESPSFTKTIEALTREGHTLEQVSLLVDAVGSGRIAQVVIPGKGLRASFREALQGLVGLQVLPEGSADPRRRTAAHSVFGVTEYRIPDSGEIWRMNFPIPPNAPTVDLRRIVALTPLQDSAGEDGIPLWTLVTLEPVAQEAGATHLQIWSRTSEIDRLREGGVVQVARVK